MNIEVLINTSKIKTNLKHHFHVRAGKKEKIKFDFIYMNMNGHGLPCQSRKKGKDKGFMALREH